MIRIATFKPEHLYEMQMREIYKNELEHVGVNELLGNTIEAQTAYIHDHLVCCYGITEDGGVWMLTSDKVFEYGRTFARAAKAQLKIFLRGRYSYTWCKKDSFHARWMRYMGYKAVDEEKVDDLTIVKYEVA